MRCSGSQRSRSTSLSPYPTWSCSGRPRVDRGPGQRGDHRGVGDPVGAGVVGPECVERDQHVELAGPLAGQVEAAPVGRDALGGDGLGLREPLPDGGHQLADRGAGRQQVLGGGLEPEDLVRAGPGVGEGGDLGRRADLPGQEAGVDEERVDAGRRQHPPGHLLVAERLPAHHVGVGVGVRLEPEQRGAVPADGEAEHRVERRPGPAPGAGALVHQRLERRPVEVPQHQAVAVVVDERLGDVRRLVVRVHAVSSTFSSESDRRRASPGDAIITTATSSTQPNATTGNQRAGLSSG